ncbi:MAG: hypothetical protein ABR605_04135 [Desulfurivibrionaceae bacterium]
MIPGFFYLNPLTGALKGGKAAEKFLAAITKNHSRTRANVL